jgi:folate-binding protein YgfZ
MLMAERTPLYNLAAKAQAVFVEDAGWLLPARYGDTITEYLEARRRAVVFDVSHWGKVELTGPDAGRFLHNLCTNAVADLPLGAGREALLTNAQARVVSHALIYHLPQAGTDVWWLDVAPRTADKVVKHLNHYLISEQVEIADRTTEYTQLHVAGPEAAALLEMVVRADVKGLAVGGLVEGTFRRPSSPKEPDDPSSLRTAMIRIPTVAAAHIRRHDLLGLPGYDLVCPRGRVETVWQHVTAAGARPAGLEAFHILRVEAGTPLYGVDIDESNLAPEVGRTQQAISYTKGCYLGQEPIVRIRDLGHVNRSLLGVKIAGEEPVPRGAKLFRDGKDVGQVTSSVVSPRLGATLALAYIRRGSERPGTTLEVEAGGGRLAAEIVALPLSA